MKALKTHNVNMNGKLRETLLIILLAVMAARKHRIAADANLRKNARNEKNAEMTENSWLLEVARSADERAANAFEYAYTGRKRMPFVCAEDLAKDGLDV